MAGHPIILRPSLLNHPFLLLLNVYLGMTTLTLCAAVFGIDSWPPPEAVFRWIDQWQPVEHTRLLLALASVFLLLMLLLVQLYHRFVARYVLDDDKIMVYYGIIARQVSTVGIPSIRSVEVRQTLLQRLFGLGDVLFFSAGSDGAEAIFRGVYRPMRVKQVVHRMAMDSRR